MELRLLFLPNFPEAMFIQGGTFIPDSRVSLKMLPCLKSQLYSDLRKKSPWLGPKPTK